MHAPAASQYLAVPLARPAPPAGDGPVADRLRQAAALYPVRVPAAWGAAAAAPDGPLGRQCLPDPRELDDDADAAGYSPDDPLAEEQLAPVPGLVHRYPDRVLLLVSDACAVHCRFCTRKRLFRRGTGCPAPEPVTPDTVRRAIDWIAARPAIGEVILSGGDPLLLPDELLDEYLGRLRRIPHVGALRVHTRVPSVWPERIDGALAGLLARRAPLFLNAHFNHPAELAPAAGRALGTLADAGIPLGSQTVLLAGVNDDADTLVELFRTLVLHRVRPAYLHVMDLARGTAHFRVPLARARGLAADLHRRLSGTARPSVVVDLPGGAGKVPLEAGYLVSETAGHAVFRAPDGRLVPYPDAPEA